MSKRNYIFKECGKGCKSKQHASELISAVTHPSSIITDRQLASFLKSRCYCFDSISDELGKTILHIAASCGRIDLCRWLIKCCNAKIDSQDLESGYTSLHRSIFYGHVNVAVLLIQFGANVDIYDWEDYFPIDLVSSDLNLSSMAYIVHPTYFRKDLLDCPLTNKLKKQSGDVETSCNWLFQMSIEKQDHLYDMSNAFVTEVFTWGMNHSYTIGFSAKNSKTYPEYLEFFEKKNEIVIQICMHKHHTLFVCLSGNVWSCGLGLGGRLGLFSDETVLLPQKITLQSNSQSGSVPFPLFCIKAAVGLDHSIFMCNNNKILTCGMNTYHQLGITPPPVSINIPQSVKIELRRSRILGVAASAFHSVVWTDQELYTCGLHGGQLGHPQSSEKTVSYFKEVPHSVFHHAYITDSAASEGATVIVADTHDIYVFSSYKCRRIGFKHIVMSISTAEASVTRQNDNRSFRKNNLMRPGSILKITVFGGELDNDKMKSYNLPYRPDPLKIVLMFWDGSIYLWQEDVTRFLKCIFLLKRDIKVADVVLNSNGMLLSTYKGEAYSAEIQNVIKTFGKADDGFTLVNRRFYRTEECVTLKMNKIKNAYRTMYIFSDPKGCNFALLQSRSVDLLENFPSINSSTYYSDFKTFYLETCERDPFHDIVFQVDKKLFAAHRYILASCYDDIKLIKRTNEVVLLNNVHADIFEQMLIFAYTGSCSLLQEGPCRIKIQRLTNEKNINNFSVKYEDPLKLAIKAATEFNMNNFVELLQNFRYEKEYIFKKANFASTARNIHLRFNRLEFKNLYDVKLRSQDGNLFYAHKCILVARMEYFKNMLCGNWIESSSEYNEYQMFVSGPVLLEILEYLYTDTVTKSINKKDFNFWCSLLVAADQFILPKLKEISEDALARCLDTRNTCDILIFADVMNADQLIISCFEFISINLCSFLYTRVLEKLSDELLHHLTLYYRNEFAIRCPNVPVYNDACNPEEIAHAESIFPVDWEMIYESFSENEIKKTPLNPVRKKKKRRTRKSSSESECVAIKENKPNINKENDDLCKVSETQNETLMCESVPDEEWIEVSKQLKSVKSRLKVNAIVKDFPQLLEQKENFTPLFLKTASTSSQSYLEPELVTRSNFTDTAKSFNYPISIDFENVTPKISQKQRKILRKVDTSIKEDSFPKNVWNETSCSSRIDSNLNLSVSDCWGQKNRSDEAVCFSAIMQSEMKQKAVIKKETKRIETKSLNLIQIEDKAIQELITFYNVNNVDDECISVHRVIHDTEVPQWIAK